MKADVGTVTFHNTTNPYLDPPSPGFHESSDTPVQMDTTPTRLSGMDWSAEPQLQHAVNGETQNDSQAYGLEALSAAASGDHLTYRQHPLTAQQPKANVLRQERSYTPSEPSPSIHSKTPSVPSFRGYPLSPSVSTPSSHNNSLNYILNSSTIRSPPIDPNLHSPFDDPRNVHHRSRSVTSQPQPSLIGEDTAETEHELAFLLRHFSEGPGQWMDLFDLGQYFGSYVPVKALTNPLLKYAAASFAAKALGRTGGKKPIMAGPTSHQASMEIYPNSEQTNWFYVGAKYYDKAISLLMEALKGDRADLNSPVGHWNDVEEQDRRKRRRIAQENSQTNNDEILAATAILCVYEFLDASGSAWTRHLNGAKSLIDIAERGMNPLNIHSPLIRRCLTPVSKSPKRGARHSGT